MIHLTPSAQSRKDAENDAETLRNVAREHYPHVIYDPVYAAGCDGTAAGLYMATPLSWCAVQSACSAAHAAFRACPGLR